MQYRAMGRLGVEVSAIGFGGGAVSGKGGGYGFGHIDEDEALRVLRHAFDRGITLFDTAPVYGWDLSEQRIGKALHDVRDQVFLVSKAGVVQRQPSIDNSPENIRVMLERSLRNLQTDHLDLYLLHWPDPNVPIEKSMACLRGLKEQGKIRAIGLSNFDASTVRRAQAAERVDVLQNPFNLFRRGIREELFGLVVEYEMGLMGYGTLHKGMLCGRMSPWRKFDEVDVRSRMKMDEPSILKQYYAFGKISQMLEGTGHTPLELAIGFVLSHPEVSTALCGMRTTEQVDTACAALDHPPPGDAITQALKIIQEAGR